MEHEEYRRKGHGEDVRDRLCGVNTDGAVADDMRHNINEGQEQNELPHHRNYDRRGRVSERNEGHLARDLDAEQDHSAKINAESL